ncbi:MAG: hypothetical protein IJ764_01640 [Bacteroidales bacterium]|nr:hypothetical protein [Bacteroidales bacterium]
MRVTIYPYINTTAGYEIAQLCSEGTVDERIQMLRCHHQSCRQVVSYHNNIDATRRLLEGEQGVRFELNV